MNGNIRRRSGRSQRGELARAAHGVIETLEPRQMLAVTPHLVTWQEQGPGVVTGTFTGSIIPAANGVGQNPSAGAVHAIATLANAPDIIYIGSVNGGVWRTLNGTAANPTWEPLGQNLGSLSIGALSISPFDAQGNLVASAPTPTTPAETRALADRLVLRAGTALFSSSSIGGSRTGLYRSVNGGRSWLKVLGRTAAGRWSFQGLNIHRIVPSASDANTYLMAVAAPIGKSSAQAGVWLTNDNGLNFKQVVTGDATDLIADPSNPSRFYAAIGDVNFGTTIVRGVYRGDNATSPAGVWTLVNGPTAAGNANTLNAGLSNGIDDDRNLNVDTDGLEGLANAGNIRLAISQAGAGSVLFVGMVSDQTNRLMGLYRTTDNGATWQPLPTLTVGGNIRSTPNINAGGQGFNNFSMVADPSNANHLYIAGDHDPAGISGIIWHANLTPGAAAVWDQASNAGASSGGNPTAPHPDTRNMLFDSAGGILQVDDGGVYRLNDPANTSNARRWVSKNGDLRLGEFWSVARDATRGTYFGGQQDIGVIEQPVSGNPMDWTYVSGGDGAVVQISGQFHYSSGNNFGSFERRNWTGSGAAATLVSVSPNLRVVGTGASEATLRTLNGSGIVNGRFDAFPFITQFAVNTVPPAAQANTRILIGSRTLYESFDDGAHVIALEGLVDLRGDGADDDGDGNMDAAGSPDPDEIGPVRTLGRVTAVAYGGFAGATAMPDIAYVGSGGKQLRVRSTMTRTPGGAPAPTLADFALRPAYPGSEIVDIVLNPVDWQKGYVLDDSGGVYAFQNTGSTAADWRRITGIHGALLWGGGGLQTIEVVRTVNTNVVGEIMVLVGGRSGVFATLDPTVAQPVWFEVGQGLPNAVVRDLRFDDPNNVLYCGTMGRGAWSISNFTTSFLPVSGGAAPGQPQPSPTPDPGTLEITGDELADKNDTIRLALNEANPEFLDVFVNNATGIPDMTVAASAVRKVLVTGGQGNDTLVLDHVNGLVTFSGGVTFDEAGPGDDVQQEVNLTPIEGGVIARLRLGLQGLADWAATLSRFGDLAREIPALGLSLADTFAIGDGSDPLGGVLRQGLVEPLLNYFDTDASPSVQELLQKLRSLSQPLGKVSFGIDPLGLTAGVYDTSSGGQELRVNLDLNLRGFADAVSLRFGASLEALGISFDAGGVVDLSTALDLSFAFGVDLTPGLSDADAFFISVSDLRASARISAGTVPFQGDPATKTLQQKRKERVNRDSTSGPGLDVGLRVGFLDARIVGGTFELDAAASVQLNNPDNSPDGHITLTELRGNSLDSLIDVSMTGSLNAHLPVVVSLAGFGALRPTIRITGSDLFAAAPTVTVENFDSALDFNNLTPASILGMLKQLGEFLRQFAGSAAMGTSIPFTGRTVGELLDLQQAFTDKLYRFLEPQPGQTAFDSAQELAVTIATALGLPIEAIEARYEALSKELTFHVDLSKTIAPTTVPLDLGLQLGSLAGLSTSSTISVAASAGMQFTFGINLSAPSAVIRGASDAPANGRLPAAAQFSVQVGSNEAVDVSVAADATNNSIDDLVADINAALQAAGIAGSVRAGKDGNRITISTHGLGTPAALTITSAAGNPAQTILGLADTQTVTDTLGSRFFIKDASLNGSASLSAADIDAAARLGFLEIGVLDGGGGVSASFSAALVDPGTEAADGRITLSELFAALSGDLSTLAPSPTLTGSANLTLPLRVQPNILGGEHPAAPAATVTWTDIRDPGTLSVNFNADTERLLDFSSISYEGVVQAILQAIQYVAGLEQFSFLDMELPLLNRSVSDLLGAADALLDKVTAAQQAAPALTLQAIETVLEQAMGLAPAALTLALDGDAVKVGLNFSSNASLQIPINLDLGSLAAGVPGLAGAANLIDVAGSGKLNAAGNAAVSLNIGVDLATPTNPRPFIYDNSQIVLEARATGSSLEFTAAVGPLGLFIKNGTVNLDGDGNANTDDFARFTAGIVDDNADGRHYFDELDTSDATLSLVGQANATLPLFFPTSTQSLGNLSLAITNLADISGSTTITSPDLSAQFNLVDLLGNVGSVVDGLDMVLATLQQGLDGQVFGVKVPLIGANLKSGARFIEEVRTQAIVPLRASLAEQPPAEAMKSALFARLGPAGINFLGDQDGDGDVDLGDIGVALAPSGNEVVFKTRLQRAPTPINIPLGFDIGLPGLNLDVDGGVSARLGFDFQFAFGLNRSDGFFFSTHATGAGGASVPELSVELDATIPGLSATGRLALLQLTATDDPANPTRFTGSFSIDLKDPNNDGKLTLAEIAGGAALSDLVKAKLTANADVNLKLSAGFGPGSGLPTITTDFNLDWAFADAPTDSPAGSFGGRPAVGFNNVRLNAGEFFSNFARPVLANVQKVLGPIQPVIDILNTPLPVLSDVKMARSVLDQDKSGDVTLIDLVKLFNPSSKLDFVASLARTADLINSIPTSLGGLMLNLGRFDIGSDLRIDPQVTDADFINVVQQNIDAQLTGGAAAFNGKLADLNAVPGGAGMSFPLLKNPSSVFKLLMGQDVNLFTYDMPALKAGFEFSKFFPVLGPLGARFTGSITAAADFAFGFDTSGLRQYRDAAEGDRDLGMLLNGLYVSDRANADGTGADVKEVILTGGIEASGELNAVVASAGVSGGIFANIGFDLEDLDNDGKVRLDEILGALQRSPLCMFDVSGELTAGLSAYVKFLFKKKTFNIATVKLLDFNYSCPENAAEPDPVLATQLAGGVLRLNVGANAAQRQFGELADGDEVFVVRPGTTPGAVVVEAMGFTQEFSGVSSIVADGGAGNDSIQIKDGVTAAVSLTGGEGNDSLYGGSGAATLDGGAGDDLLRGGSANDLLLGGGENDIVLGGLGNDVIDLGIGDDVGEGGDGNDTILGGAGFDALSGGTGDDSLDGGADADDLSGDDGSDVLVGAGGDDAFDGGAGNDTLLGGDGTDVLDGGAGNDSIAGGIGHDTLVGGDGDDLLRGEADNDNIDGGAGNDTIDAGDGADVVSAGAGADSVLGGIGADIIDAGPDNDTVDAGDGNDTVHGGAGSDTVIGGVGADVLYAGIDDSGGGSASDSNLIYGDSPAGSAVFADRIVGDIGPDSIYAGAGNDIVSALAGGDFIDGGDGDDSLTGGAGADTMTGGAGHDTIAGQEGDDAIIGDAGNDQLSGDDGRDLVWGGAAAFDRAAFIAGGFAADGITPLIVLGNSIPGGIADGADTVLGGADGDWLFAGGESDQVDGGPGDDYADGGLGADAVRGDAGNDALRGGADADLLHGGGGIDQVHGDDGNDTLFGDAGDGTGATLGQRLWGGAGNDLLSAFAASTLAAEYALAGDELHGGDGDDTLRGNLRKDSLHGDGGADLLVGDALAGPLYLPDSLAATAGGADLILGGTGSDQIFGGGGNDTMFGGADSDRLEGQDGADRAYGGSGIDVIVLDSSAAYASSGDVLDGHFGNAAAGDVLDDNATDILLINGTDSCDTITLGESAGALLVNYNARVISASWRGGGVPLVEQFRVSGLGGNDYIEFISAGPNRLDLSGLSEQSADWVGVIDGGEGDDSLIGTNARDRIDGGRGSDSILGLGGDDRLLGDGGAGLGNITDIDRIFGGQGNDDQVGGQGSNHLYAWSRDPAIGEFGVFVDSSGSLHDDGGGAFTLEDTGLNRMLGSPRADSLFGGTGLDFLYGNGGADVLFNRDGTAFESLDADAAGQQWKDYARSTGKVWYVGASNRADIINVDFVTEPGALAGHHLVTRLTENNGSFSFAAQLQLDFDARDAAGRLIWDPADLLLNLDTLAMGDSGEFAGLLPPEGDFQAILIDALGGNDQVTVGPTVTRSVWIDGGDGDDRITIKSGNPILADAVEGTGRNDTSATAYDLTADARVGLISSNRLLQGMTLDSPTDLDWYRLRLASPISGDLIATGLSVEDGLLLQLFSGSTLLRSSTAGVLSLTGLAAGTDYLLRVSDNLSPTIYQLAVAVGASPAKTDLASGALILRRDIILGGVGDDVLAGGSGEDWVLGGDGNDVLIGGLDRQASDLLFGQGGDDSFQVIPDGLPLIPGSDRTVLPTLNDSFDGGEGNDRVLFLGGDIDRNNRPIPDHVAIRYNRTLHSYEVTTLVWDVANQRFDAVSGAPRQLYAFYQPHNIERTVIDTQAGDDEVRADPGYLLNGSEWGISAGDLRHNATIAGLTILGGEGNDRLLGGALADSIDGGAGLDFIAGGEGNDTITGGADNDLLAGNLEVPHDRFESVIRGIWPGRNDDAGYAADLGAITPGMVIGDLSLHLGDVADWYVFDTPDALLRLGTSQAALITSDLIKVYAGAGTSTPLAFRLCAAEQTDPGNPASMLPVERPTGVPTHYMIQVLNPNAGATPAAVPNTYRIEFSSDNGKSVHVSASEAAATINSARPADTPAVIPLGDINGDGHVDFVAAVQDYVGAPLDNTNPQVWPDYPGNAVDALRPSFARVHFGTGSAANATLSTTSLSLRLPAPVMTPSYFYSQSTFASPGDYNGDGISDIAVTVTRTRAFNNLGVPQSNEGVYIIFGRASGFSGTIDVVAGADVTLRGFAQAVPGSASQDFRLSMTPADVNDDGFDDIIIGGSATGASSQGAVHLFLGRADWINHHDRQVFNVDFSATDGTPSADSFVIDNSTAPMTAGLWHASLGHNTAPGHTTGGSMYFGAGETASGGGTYDGGVRAGRITSPSISLAGLQSARLSFNYRLQTEAIFSDRARVLIERNASGTFLPLELTTRSGVTDAGAANYTLISGSNRDALLVDPTTGWTSASFDLSYYAGSSIRIRFEFTSSSTNNAFEGWYVDDVTVTGAVLGPANASAVFSGIASGELVGASVSSVGDFNNDGNEDFAVVRANEVGLGEAYLVYGRPSTGPAFVSGTMSSVAGVIFETAKPFVKYAVRPAGDVDGDGFDDLLITPKLPSAILSDGEPPVSWLIFGRAGLSGRQNLSTLPGRVLTGRDASWTSLGDVNGDGFDDLGAVGYISLPGIANPSQKVCHMVGEVYLGRSNLSTISSLSTPDVVIEPGKPNYDIVELRDRLFDSPGDINHDGRADWILADTFGGYSRIYLGQALLPAIPGGSGGTPVYPVEPAQLPLANPTSGGGQSASPGLNLPNAGASLDILDAWSYFGGLPGERLSAPRPAGDLNADGIPDIVISGSARDYILFGPVNLSGDLDVRARANVILDGANYVRAAQRMGDIDGDGRDDLVYLYAEPYFGSSRDFEVSLAVISGGTGIPRNPTLADADHVVTFDFPVFFHSASPAESWGLSLAAMNFNGDAHDDLVLLAHGFRSNSDVVGYVFSGASMVANPDIHVGSAGEGSLLVLKQDDSDRDAVLDTFYYSRTWLGSRLKQNLSMVVPGDVNGDGLDDLVISDRGFATDSSYPPIGRTYVFIGRPNSALRTDLGTPPTYRLNHAAAAYQGVNLGAATIAVGDLNSDGYADFAVSRQREGGTLEPASLLFYYGSPSLNFNSIPNPPAAVSADTAAGQYLSRKLGDPTLQQLESELEGAVVLEGTLWATTGDFNADGVLDLAVGEPLRIVKDTQGFTLDRQESGLVFVYYSAGARSRGLSAVGADQIIRGAGEFDQLGWLSPTGPIDANFDHRGDLLIGAPGADVLTPGLVADGGRTYVAWAGPIRRVLPDDSSVGTLSNASFTGDGEFLSNPQTGQPVNFRDLDANTANYTLAVNQVERWYRFTTLGDGQSSSAIRLGSPARQGLVNSLPGSVGQLLPGLPGVFVLEVIGSQFRVGGASDRVGIVEFDLAHLLPHMEQSSLIDQVQLQLDAQFNAIAAGQTLRVFLAQSEGDGIASAADGSAAATLAGEYTFTAADAASPATLRQVRVDITAAVRSALAAGKTRLVLRLAASTTSLDMLAQSGATGTPPALAVRQRGVVGDLLNASGDLLVSRQSVISLRTRKAGNYYLRVYDPFGPQAQAMPFAIDLILPNDGNSHADADRDSISGGDGDDTLTGNDGLDALSGNSGADSLVGEAVEVTDHQAGEPAIAPPKLDQFSNETVQPPDVVVNIPDPALRMALADVLGIGHTPGGSGLTRLLLASELAQIRSIDLSNRGIANFAGLDNLIGLESLDLSHNGLASLVGIGSFPFLRHLDLGYNRLTESALPGIAHLTQLRSLTLDGNPVTSVASLAAFTNLTHLGLNGRPSTVTPPANTVRNSDLLARFTGPTPNPGGYFGGAVAQVGRYIAVGDRFDDVNGNDAGAVHLYDGRTGQYVRSFRAGGGGEQFGTALAGAGNLLAVGTPLALDFGTFGAGLVRIYNVETGQLVNTLRGAGGIFGTSFGTSLAMLGDDLIVGETAPSFGSGTVHRYDLATGQLIGSFSGSGLGDRLGTAIAVDATTNRIFAGAPGRDLGASDTGAIYSIDATNFSLVALIANPTPVAFSGFGTALAAVGGDVAATTNSAAGIVVHVLDGDTGALLRTHTTPSPGIGFGQALAPYSDSLIVVGAPLAPGDFYRFGSVYVVNALTGAIVQTIASTTPTDLDRFGATLGTFDSDILVGAPGMGSGSSLGSAALVKGPRISDITPLAALTSLKTLNLADNRIANPTALAALTNLDNLDLRSNQIAANLLLLNGIAGLDRLNLAGNPLDNTSHTTHLPLLQGHVADLDFTPNQAPVLPYIAPRAMTVGAILSVPLAASDPDSDPIYVAAVSDTPQVTVLVVGGQLQITAASFTGVANITTTVFDGPSGAQDGRGRSATRSFAVSVGLGAITGIRFEDFDADGVRDPDEPGLAGATVFIDNDTDGELDPGEPTAITDADGNYAFNGLPAGTYHLAQTGPAGWRATTPRTSFDARFTGGAADGFTTSGVADPWHTSDRRGADNGHSPSHSFYVGSEATGTYANNITAILSSPVVDLRGLNAAVRLDFNHRLNAIDSSTTPSSADFQAGGAPNSSSADGYTTTSLWHLSQGRGTQSGHSQRFSMYFGTGESGGGGGNYTASSTGTLLSPLINLSGLTGANINLALNYVLNANVGASAFDDQATITVISGGSRTLIASNAAGGALSNATSGWLPLSLDLSAFGGQQIQLEFKFQANADAFRGEGWYIDDVVVSSRQIDIASVGVFANGVYTPLADNFSLGSLPDDTGGIFAPVSLDLAAFRGQQVQIQFRFTSDASLAAEGWYVDDVKLAIGGTTQVNLTAGTVATGPSFGGIREGITFSSDAVYTVTGLPSAPVLNVTAGIVTITPVLQATLPDLAVNVGPGARLELDGPAPGAVFTFRSVQIDAGGTLDLGDSTLIMPGASPAAYESLRLLLQTGYNNGTWNGSGIITSAAQPSRTLALTRDPAGNARVSLELAGDFDRNGRVDIDDYFIIDKAYALATAGGWAAGDADFSGGPPAADDYFIIDRGFLTQGQGSAVGSPSPVPLPIPPNAAPAILLPGVAAMAARLLLDGSLVDDAPGLLTATVDYDDGLGPQHLAIRPDQTFSLDHTYPAPGLYQVRVAIRDSGGATASHLLQLTIDPDVLVVSPGAFSDTPIRI